MYAHFIKRKFLLTFGCITAETSACIRTHVFVITVLWVINKCGHTSFPTDLILLAIDVTDNPIYLYYTYKYRQYDDQRGTLQSRDTRPW